MISNLIIVLSLEKDKLQVFHSRIIVSPTFGKSTPSLDCFLKLGSTLPTLNMELSRNSGVLMNQSCGNVPNTSFKALQT